MREYAATRSGSADCEDPLRPVKDAVPHGVTAIVAQQIGVAVAREAAGSFAERHQAAAGVALDRHLELADRRLVVRHAQVFGPVFRRDIDRQAGRERAVDHLLVDAFGMQVNLDRRPQRATPSNTVPQKS